MTPMIANKAKPNVTANCESVSSSKTNESDKHTYHELIANAFESGLASAHMNKENTLEGHIRNRTTVKYEPGTVQVPKAIHTTVSGSHSPIDASTRRSAPTTWRGSRDLFCRRLESQLLE
jgi:protein-serine/threonine kinase